MKEMKNRGLGTALASWINTMKPGKAFTLDDACSAMAAEFPDANRMAVSNALSWLGKKEYLTIGVLRGTYTTPARVNGAQMNPAQAIYDLLDFMAKAEAPLRRAAKILEAVDGAS